MEKNQTDTNEQTWDAIAESFDKTRKKPWKTTIDYINSIPKNTTVLDIGCGNGRHLVPCTRQCKHVIGLDISKNLLKIVDKKIKENKITNATLVHGNMICLPIGNNSIDSVLCIASIHNVKGRQNRILVLKEIYRILKKNSTAFISVWSRWQDRFLIHHLKKIFTHDGEFGDIDIYWKQNKLNVARFYHLYSKRELIKDLRITNFSIEEIIGVKHHSKWFADNYFVKVRKE